MFDKCCAIAANICDQGYTLIEIEEECIPLSGLPKSDGSYFFVTVGAMIAVILIGTLALYLFGCYGYRKRIRQLRRGQDVYCGWKLWRLRETVKELEMQEVEQIVTEMQEIFKKNIQEIEVIG